MRTFEVPLEAMDYVLETYCGNAAGTCKDAKTALKFAAVGMPVVTFGSLTINQQDGNAGDNFYYDEATGASINAWGIPNRGLEAYILELKELREELRVKSNSRLAVSISGGKKFDPKDYYAGAKMLRETGAADIIEGNKSCGNMKLDDGTYKPVVCYDKNLFAESVIALREGAGDLVTSVKIMPTTEMSLIEMMVETCLDQDINYIVAANTTPNVYLEKAPGIPAITMVRGGLGGKPIVPIIQSMVMSIVPMLKGTPTKLVAVGGITRGQDAYDYMRLGAHGWGYNSWLSHHNCDPKTFSEICMGGDAEKNRGLISCLVEYGLPD